MKNTPNVYFGPEIWSLQSEGGISRYFSKLISGLHQDEVNKNILLQDSKNRRILDLDKRNFDFKYIKNSKNIYKEISKILDLNSNDKIYHPTYYSKDIINLKSKNTKIVLTVFDMISELFPEKKPRLRKPKDAKKICVSRADHIICISNQTKKDLIQIYDIPDEKISVTYLGSDLHLLPIIHSKRIVNSKYILYVGKRGGYKNFKNLLSAYSESSYLKSEYLVVAAGGGAFNNNERVELERLNVSSKVVQIDLDDQTLSQLYRDAECLVYPSLYEGFGLPPIEAMSLYCPVIASAAGSIPEICHDAASYFEPSDLTSIIETLTNTLQNEKKKNVMRLKGLEIASKYSWENTAKLTLEVYENLG